MEYYSAIRKDKIPSFEAKMDEPGGNYVKLNKPASKRQTPYVLTH